MNTPVIALLYDFDKTLCTTDMEDYTFIPALGYTPGEFWGRANDFGRENRMDGLLAYMYTMMQECRRQGIRLDREFLVRCGEGIELFCSPMTQRMASEMFDLPEPFGPTMAVISSPKLRTVLSGKDLNP